jgi:hypothetical protein
MQTMPIPQILFVIPEVSATRITAKKLKGKLWQRKL